ncbi:hypothetical protein SADUNF_Sadunf02G0131400 [Salix dunnii]|uniref:Uncharacterized protein n=1 Tax=Salix dunnii TaxID=1413687 RepID=A0A835N7N5_9ROSI|nr:hypothetical protein SADUNF_Sadunf02G0131400 [Salix dunnii]
MLSPFTCSHLIIKSSCHDTISSNFNEMVLRGNRKRVLLFLLFLRITIFEFTIREVQETIKREISREGWGSSKQSEAKGKWGDGASKEKMGRE